MIAAPSPARARGSTSGHDLRDGGAWTPLQRAKNDALWAAAVIALAATRSLPIGALRALGRSLGLIAYALAAGPRRTARDNVTRVFPGLAPRARRALVRRAFATLGEHLGETVALLGAGSGPPPLPLAPEARATLDEARAEGRGVVFVSAHLGPWERVAASLVAAGVPLVTLARESYDPRFTRLYERLRSSGGVRVVWRSRPAAAARMVRTLRGGGVLGMPMDLSSRVPSSPVPFLGHPAPTPTGPARLALRTGAAVVVGTAAPIDAAARGPSALVITATRVATSDLLGRRPGRAGAVAGRDDEGVLTARINEELSRRILRWPEAWVWMHDRWTERAAT